MKNEGVIIGMSGFFAGGIAAACVDWDTLPKAALAMGVAVGVSMIVLALTRGR
jgi:hypothetical protein